MVIMISGMGSIGRRHLRNLLALGEHDVVLLRTGMSKMPDEDLGRFPVERDLDHALERWRPEAVIVANPSALHLDIAIPAAEAGCHLLIEKPLSHSMDRVDELRSALERGGGHVLVGFQFRFHPGLRTVRRLLGEGVIGRPASALAYWGEYLPDWHPWEDYRQSYAARRDLGGGALLTLCHPFDYLRWLLGEVESVSARASYNGALGLDVEESADIILALAGGALAGVHLDYLRRPPAHWLEIVGTRGTLRWDNADGAVHCWSEGAKRWQVHPAPPGFERNAMFMQEMQHFLDLVAGRAESACTLEDGVRALQIALAARDASGELRETKGAGAVE
jgi:predicted dehydrogenase